MSFSFPSVTGSTSRTSLASMSGLSMGTVVPRSPTDYQYAAQDARTKAKSAYTNPSRPNTVASTARPVSVPRTTTPRLSFPGIRPSGATTLSGASLSLPRSVPTSSNANGFSINRILGAVGLSMGTPEPVRPSNRVTTAYSMPRPNTMASTARPVEISTPRQDPGNDFLSGLLGAAADRFQNIVPASAIGPGPTGGGSDGPGISPMLLAGGVALFALVLLMPRGSGGGPPRARTSRPPRRRKARK